MKTRIIIALSSILIIASAFTLTDVPQAVLDAFSKKFADAKKVEWEFEDNIYEAEFKLGGKEQEAGFKENGEWIFTAIEAKTSVIADDLIKAIMEIYPGYEIDEVKTVDHVKHGECYDIELKGEDKEIDLLVSLDGEVLESKVEENKEDED